MKKNIVIGVLIVIVLIMGGSLYYLNSNKDKVLNNCDTQKTEPSKKEEQIGVIGENQKEETVKNSSTFIAGNNGIIQNFYSGFEGEGAHIVVDKDGQAYLDFIIYENDSEYNRAKKNALMSQYEENKIDGYQSDAEECNLGKNNVFNGIKLPVTNVISAHAANDGQDYSSSVILLIKSDGTVSGFNVADLLDKGKLNIKNNIGELKNVVSIVESSTLAACGSMSTQTYAIDSTGRYHMISIHDIH